MFLGTQCSSVVFVPDALFSNWFGSLSQMSTPYLPRGRCLREKGNLNYKTRELTVIKCREIPCKCGP